MIASGQASEDLLKAREDDYLAGRPLTDVPGLKLRQESVGPMGGEPIMSVTATTTVTFYTPLSFPTPTPFFASSKNSAGNGSDLGVAGGADIATYATRPWLVSSNKAMPRSNNPSNIGLVVWMALLIAQDIWFDGC
jgi:hypothetical protein